MLLLALVIATGCSDRAGEPETTSKEQTVPTKSSTGTAAAERVLIPDAVRAWPQVTVTDCESYRPTHTHELAIVGSLSRRCIEAAFRSTSAVFFSSWTTEPISQTDRSAYEVWGEIDGHEILVRVRGDEHISGYRTRDARIDATGEIAVLAVGRPPEGSLDEAGAWPYGVTQ
ncbi:MULTISPECIES: hypothetical protein [Nocardioides]|uniref:DUF3558 domain-containing protein n=1 Tax=Nocardioides vastitatis TaxID=2568655 RepID=A0ABW0ZP86_9ACTN|nr:hypothetical protein [Nocardioides sp.]THI94077.1 hypothetical protein E7Z54_20290 [Nocardioides sp.]